MDTVEASVAMKKSFGSSICALMLEAGFTHGDRECVEKLTEAAMAFMSEVGRSAKLLAEHTGRSEVNLNDVSLALIEMGHDISTIPSYYDRSSSVPIKVQVHAPLEAPKPPQPKILESGEKLSHFPYIPDHFPPFPDSHSYIRTEVYKQPICDYEVLRESSATHKRDIERALSKFKAKTSNATQCFFPDDTGKPMFPLIPLKTTDRHYWDGFLAQDQVFEEDEDSDDEKEKEKDKEKDKNATINGDVSMDDSINGNGDGIRSEGDQGEEKGPKELEGPDNPYLRKVSLHKKTKRPTF